MPDWSVVKRAIVCRGVATAAAFMLVAANGWQGAAAQSTIKPETLNAVVVGVGRVTSTTPIVAGNRTSTGDMHAALTVTTLNNGPYYLQAKLTVPFTDKQKPSIVNTVQALTPLGNYVSLSTTTWVNVATGPGGTGKVNNVQLLVLWAKSSSKDPKQIPDIKLSYQVVPK